MKPIIVRVDLAENGYDVLIGNDLVRELGARVRTSVRGRRVVLVTDAKVGELHGVTVEAEMLRGGLAVDGLTVPAGETSKSWALAGELVEAFASAGLGRTDAVVALGGGVVGDLAGFAAAVYLRGVDFVQIPTTLLAQVDSSVGGKTGVDLLAGKNLAGAFKQPRIVIADVSFLETMPDAEWASGFAEIAKGAIIDSEEFLAWLESDAGALVAHDTEAVIEAVRRAVAFKARVVMQDERESRERECLNYGHTLGHAIEKVAGFGTYSHGAAVAEGIRFAAQLASRVAGADEAFTARQNALLEALGLPPLHLGLDAEALLEAMKSDKKVRDGKVRFVLVTAPGKWSTVPVDDDAVVQSLREYLG